MNWLDALIIIVAGFNIYTGFRRGLIKIIFDLLALLLSVYGAIQLTQPVRAIVTAQFPITHSWATVLAFIIVWVVLYIVFIAIGNLLEKLLTIALLNPINRIGGALFGFGKAILIMLPILIPLIYFNIPAVNGSILVQHLRPPIEVVIDRFLSRLSSDDPRTAQQLPVEIQTVLDNENISKEELKKALTNVVHIIESDP